MKKTRAMMVLIMVAGCVQVARAELITYEGFDYTSGQAVSGLSGGSGWLGGWAVDSGSPVVGSSGLSDANALPSTGLSTTLSVAQIRRSLDRDGVWASFTESSKIGGGSIDDVVYGSLLVSSANWTASRYIFSLYDAFGGGEVIRMQQTAEGSGFRLTDASNNVLDNGGSVPGLTGSDTVLLVWKVDFNANADDQMTLWVDPTSESSSSISLSTATDLGFNQFQVRNLAGGEFVDEIRFGTTFDAVAIPEPAMFGLLLATLSGAVLLRRRRSKK